MASGTESNKRIVPTPCGYLPLHIRVLFIAGDARSSGWLADAFANDRASDVALEEVRGMAAGLARLRDDIFDAVLVSHEAGLDALELLDALRGGGGDEQSLVVLGEPPEQELAAVCYEAGADAYVCIRTTTTRALIWIVARAIERRRLIAETRRLEQARQRRLELERDEASRLLEQQQAILHALPTADGGPAEENPTSELAVPEALVEHYRELLRTYVIMGSGNLRSELDSLSELLASSEITARQALEMHLRVLENMIQGLGNRSARHVMNRADMLILEVTVNLCERYRSRLSNQLHPPRQLLLPGISQLP